MKKLIINGVPNNLNEVESIVIGPWCYLEKQEKCGILTNLYCEPDPYENSNSIKKDADFANYFTESLLDKIAGILNEKNKINFSLKFWRIVLIPWLSTLVQVTLERQRRIEKIIEKYSNEKIEVNLVKNDNWYFEDTVDFLKNGIHSIEFNAWLCGHIIENIKPQNWIIFYSDYKGSERIQKKNNDSLKSWLKSEFYSTSVYGINFIDAFLIELLLLLKNLKSLEGKNKTLHTYGINTDFNGWKVNWDYLISATLPNSFRNLKIPRTIRKKNIIAGPVLYYNEMSKVKIAKNYEAGANLILNQHGCRYGTLKSIPFISQSEYGYNKFITWGWQAQSNYRGEFYDLPSPYIKKSSKKKKKNFVFVGQHSSLLSYRLDSAPQPLDHFKIRDHQVEFLTNIKSEVFSKLKYRSYPESTDKFILFYNSYIQKKIPKINFYSGSFNNDIYNSELLIIDHPGTVFHQRMGANLPLIAYWDPKMWGLCEQAEPYFDKLHKVEVLFYDPIEASKKLNSVYNNIVLWWEEPERQNAVKEWAWVYARNNKNWRREWAKMIWKM